MVADLAAQIKRASINRLRSGWQYGDKLILAHLSNGNLKIAIQRGASTQDVTTIVAAALDLTTSGGGTANNQQAIVNPNLYELVDGLASEVRMKLPDEIERLWIENGQVFTYKSGNKIVLRGAQP